MRERGNGKLSVICVVIFFVFLCGAALIENTGIPEYDAASFLKRVETELHQDVISQVFPLWGYAGGEMWEKDLPADAEIYLAEMPFYQYVQDELEMVGSVDNGNMLVQINQTEERNDYYVENKEDVIETPEFYKEMINENHHAVIFARDSDFFTGGSGFVSEISTFWITEFIKADHKTVEYGPEQLNDYEFVMENFYTVDACTSAGPDVIHPAEFLTYDVKIDKTMPGPHILIYHTHSQEAFVDSIEGDKSTTIVGAGAKLSEVLREEYGYEVYHHTGEYDKDTRDDAYAKSAPALEEILEQYPQIQVVIDLHRDGVAEGRHLVTEWEGKKIAQFMFFNGLSYVNHKGPIDYLPNPNLKGNLALSFQATVMANEYYPGLARRTYLNGYRYNMHYREKSMLIELGAQTNTVDEIMSACEPLAHILDMVFSGKENRG